MTLKLFALMLILNLACLNGWASDLGDEIQEPMMSTASSNNSFIDLDIIDKNPQALAIHQTHRSLFIENPCETTIVMIIASIATGVLLPLIIESDLPIYMRFVFGVPLFGAYTGLAVANIKFRNLK